MLPLLPASLASLGTCAWIFSHFPTACKGCWVPAGLLERAAQR